MFKSDKLRDIHEVIVDKVVSKTAYDMGFRIKSVFVHSPRYDDVMTTKGQYSMTHGGIQLHHDKDAYPAPISEEVPLPDIGFDINGDTYIVVVHRNYVIFTSIDNPNYDLYRKHICEPNEATARLKMAIWLAENVQQIRQWCIDNGYLQVAGLSPE